MAVLKPAEQGIVRDAVVLDLGDLARQGEILRQHARKQADAILAEARAERARILAGASEQGRAEGYARGLEDGKTKGREEGQKAALAEWKEKLGAMQASWGGALDAFEAVKDDLIEDARCACVRLAMEIARRVTRRAVQADPAVVEGQLASVLAAMARPAALTIAVDPGALEVAKAAMPALLSRFSTARHAELTADASLPPGSCVARTAGGGGIDASIATQLDRIAAALLPGDETRRLGAEADGAWESDAA
jgi:flagellar assembly protein FliH